MAEALEEALSALAGPGQALSQIDLPDEPGLYALYADEDVWIELSLGPPPDRRPLYVGKAERSLAKRVGREHFQTGRTPKSTVRRTLAALLRDRLGLHAVVEDGKRASGYGLVAPHDERLTDWMKDRLSVGVHSVAELEALHALEKQVAVRCEPPLNQDGVDHHWKGMVERARKATAEQARYSAEAIARLRDLAGRIEIEDVRRDLR